ncbi:MAG: hypothetical protein JW795_08110 [Chitinivibrionales bacterium]|nr:hypothetical protein [Chitinivibrionales bacterium]
MCIKGFRTTLFFSLAVTITTSISTPVVCAAATIQKPLWLSIVGEDFAVIPLARYSNNLWSFQWPTAEKFDSTRPPAVEIPKEQFFYPLNGRLQPMTLARPQVIATQCQQHWAYSTTMTTAIFDPQSNELRNFIGIALTNDSIMIDYETDVSEMLSGTLGAQLTAKITALEAEKIKLLTKQKTSSPAQSPFPNVQAQRDSVPVDLSLYSIPTDTSDTNPLRLYRFEARKKYVDFVSEENCPGYTNCYGWIAVSGKTIKKYIDCELSLGDCQDDGSASIQSLGIITLNNSRVWVGIRRYNNREFFELYGIKSDGIQRIAQRLGGGCTHED